MNEDMPWVNLTQEEVEDVNTRKDLMTKWVHSAFLEGYKMGRYEGLEVGLTNND